MPRSGSSSGRPPPSQIPFTCSSLSPLLLPPTPLRTPLLLHSHSHAGSFQRLVCCIIYHVKCARHTAANQTSPRTRELRMLPSHPLCSMQPRLWQTDSCTGWPVDVGLSWWCPGPAPDRGRGPGFGIDCGSTALAP